MRSHKEEYGIYGHEPEPLSAAGCIKEILSMMRDILFHRYPEEEPLSPELEKALRPSLEAADQDLLEGRSISIDNL